MGVMERMSSPAPGEGDTLDNLHLHPRSLGKCINSASTSGQWRLMLLRKGRVSSLKGFLEREGFHNIYGTVPPSNILITPSRAKNPTALLHAGFSPHKQKWADHTKSMQDFVESAGENGTEVCSAVTAQSCV